MRRAPEPAGAVRFGQVMKLLARRSGRAEPEIDEAAVAERLRRLAGRGRDETALYRPRAEPPPRAEPRIKRLFWVPDEIE